MIPCAFAEENGVLEKPDSMSHEECTPLSVFVGQAFAQNVRYDVVVSCWKFTREELDELSKTGRLWLVVYGRGMPPVDLTTHSPFTNWPKE